MQQSRRRQEEHHDDELMAWFLNLWANVEANYTRILVGAGIGIGVVLVALFIYRYQAQQEQAAQEALGDVYIALFENRISDAIAASRDVMEKYPGKVAAKEALIAIANLHYEEGRVAEARAHFQHYLDENEPAGPLGYGAWAGLASCLEAEGKFAEAAQKFASFASVQPKSPFAPVALKEAGRCYDYAQMPEQAKEMYQKVISQYGESSVARTAKGELSMMGVDVE